MEAARNAVCSVEQNPLKQGDRCLNNVYSYLTNHQKPTKIMDWVYWYQSWQLQIGLSPCVIRIPQKHSVDKKAEHTNTRKNHEETWQIIKTYQTSLRILKSDGKNIMVIMPLDLDLHINPATFKSWPRRTSTQSLVDSTLRPRSVASLQERSHIQSES